jgi:hypothetical protein
MKVRLFLLLVGFIFFLGLAGYKKIGPKIRIEPEYWDFGKIERGRVVEKVFLVKNIGDEDLVIESVFTSCGCVTAQLASYYIPPNQEAELKVTYNSEGMAEGEDVKDVYIISNDPSLSKIKIRIRIHIVIREEIEEPSLTE